MVTASIQAFLNTHSITYRIFKNQELSATEKSKILKVQLLTDAKGIMLAVHLLEKQIDFLSLKHQLQRSLNILPDFKINRIFIDCDGVYPPFGEPYGLTTLIDSSIEQLDYVYFQVDRNDNFIQISAIDYLKINAKAIKLPLVKQISKLVTEHDKLLAACSFPNLPPIAVKLLQIKEKNYGDTQALIELLSNDQEINQHIMQYARLSIFAEKNQKNINNVQDAISHVLGFDTVSHIALGVAAVRVFNIKKNTDLNLKEFWQHSLLVAIICDYLARQAKSSIALEPQIAYLAGLFHNFGFLLFSHLFPPEFRLLVKWMKLNPKVPIYILERRLLGMGLAFNIVRCGHAQLGAWLLRHWKMPEPICVITKEHHNDKYNGQYADYVHVIQITNNLLRAYGIGDGEYGELNLDVLNKLGLDQAQIQYEVGLIVNSANALESSVL